MQKLFLGIWGVLCGSVALAQDYPAPTYTVYGTPGLIEMPTAESAPDAELALTGGWADETQHYTLTFQMLPRLSGSFRYSRLELDRGGETFTRAFDIRYRFMDEGYIQPAVAIGFQDFIGTGQYSGEYIVATKHITPKLTFSGGVGWGRFGSRGIKNPLRVFDNRFEDRPTGFSGRGGNVEANRWFRGDMGIFGGVAWHATDKLVLKAEFSSDDKRLERRQSHFNYKTPLNFGVDYALGKYANLQAFYLYGDQIGASLTLKINPKDPPVTGDITPGPLPVKPRDVAKINEMAWAENPNRLTKLQDGMATVLQAEGITLEAVDFDPRIVTVRIRNNRYLAPPEAIGRTARIMTQVMPASVSIFRIVPVVNGVATSAVSLKRSDLEQLENAPDGAWKSYVRARISDFPYYPGNETLTSGVYPKFTWGIGPDLTFSRFDPDNPLRYEVLAKLDLEYNVLPGLYFNGTITQPLFGTRDDVKRRNNSVLPHVRTDTPTYDREQGPRLNELVSSYFFRPGDNLYGRVTGGYLERMFGGVSGEILWKPVDSRLALGVETNYVWQRDFNQHFGFRDYNVATGHASAYYDLGYGFHAQIDAGRYLAKDWGATFTLTREFANGWRIGAYATKTDVSASEFGEGSFDKGIIISAPLGHIIGTATRQRYNTVIQPLTRDGGARLHVRGRLYNRIRDYHQPELKKRWGKFWR